MKGYKGFNKDLACRGKQYELGRTEHEDAADLCNSGMHFCTNPHDVFSYYSPGEGHRFCEVDADDVTDQIEDDSKRCAKTLTVKAEISVFQICRIAVSTFFENFGFKKKIESADTNVAGDWGAANAGYKGAANAGYKGAANAGDWGAANAGDWGAANAGDWGAANAGYKGAASVGKNGVAIVSTGGKARGGKGSVIVLVNRDDDGNITEFKAVPVDGETVKSDTWYTLKDGELVEAE